MIKNVKDRVWAFDAEWIPDPVAGRLLYGLPDAITDPREVMEVMWREGGATDEDPTPYLKTVLCRIVSIAAVERRVQSDGSVAVKLTSLPHDPENAEETAEPVILASFLEALGKARPQLVGYNSIQSDLKILVQRGIVNGVHAGDFCHRPDKPWEGVDYFARGSEWNVDLKDIVGGFGRGMTPSLHEIATLSGIPGKMDVDGNQVADLWLEGELGEIVRYNEFDALTTYLLFLRVAHFAGHFSAEQHEAEQEAVRDLLRTRSAEPGGAHLSRYLEEWERLRTQIARHGARS